MGKPTDIERGSANRGTENKLRDFSYLYPIEKRLDSLAFFGGQSRIPDALADALKLNLDLDAKRNDLLETRQKIARKLIGIWSFLKTMEMEVERDPSDLALLVIDADLSTIKVINDNEYEYELQPWKPTQFPRNMKPSDIAHYPKRPRKLDEIPPFLPSNVEFWIALRDFRPTKVGKKISKDTESDLLVDNGPSIADKPKNEKALQKALDEAMLKVEQSVLAAVQANSYQGSTPMVNSAIATLKIITLGRITRETGIPTNLDWQDQPLIKATKIILYHSVYTVVLDEQGNPFDIFGKLDLPILYPDKTGMIRAVPPPSSAIYVSVNKIGSVQIDHGKIKKRSSSGVGGFIYHYGYSAEDVFHKFHEIIQTYLEDQKGYIAAITMESAKNPDSITTKSIKEKLPQVIEASLSFTVTEIEKRVKENIDYEVFSKKLREVGKESIRSIIMDIVRDQIKNYLVKKGLKKIVPYLNVAFAIYDFDDVKTRHVIACLLLAIKGKTKEDITISAKVLSKIMADEFEGKVMEKLIELGAKRVIKAASRVRKPTQSSPSQSKTEDRPSTKEKVIPKDTSPPPSNNAKKVKPPASKPPYDVVRDSTPQELRDAAARLEKNKNNITIKSDVDNPVENKLNKDENRSTSGKSIKPGFGNNNSSSSLPHQQPKPIVRYISSDSPYRKPRLVSNNVRLSGDTAGTGGIKEIRAHRRQDGSLFFEIQGELKPPLKRKSAPNYNKYLPTGKDIGLADYEKAHLWGPGFGDEARDGIAYAPGKKVNRALQNHGVESRLRELQTVAKKEGATIELTAKSETYPIDTWRGHEMLKEVSYRFDVRRADGTVSRIGQVDISVPPPRSSAEVTVKVSSGSAEVWSLN